MKWEYLVIATDFNGEIVTENRKVRSAADGKLWKEKNIYLYPIYANNLGASGWELISTIILDMGDHSVIQYIFKREAEVW